MYKMYRQIALSIFVLAAVLWGSISWAQESREVLLYGFESSTALAWEGPDKFEYVPDYATQGDNAGKVTLDKNFDLNFGFWGGANMAGNWDQFDQFLIDVYVKGGSVKAFGWVKDNAGQSWGKRYNYEFRLAPGKRRLTFSLGAFARQKDQSPLDLKRLEFFAIRFQSLDAKKPATIYVDNARLVKGTGAFEVKVLYSFEGDDEGKYLLEDWPPEFKGKSAMKVVGEHVTQGKNALCLDSRAPAGNVQFSGFDPDWDRFDTLAFDVFNSADKPVKVQGWIRPVSETAGWWDRHNYERVLKPGSNSVKLSLGGMTHSKGKLIDLSQIASFNIAIDRQTVFIDNIRLVKGVEEVQVKGIRKFDFGPARSAGMPGFTSANSTSSYTKGRGWGWLPGGRFGRDFDMMEMLGRHRPPDDLCRDFVMPVHATFAVDLLNGEYCVWVMLGPPGNGWGQYFRHRTVTAEGRIVVDERYDVESFKKHEFQFEDTEDLPGDDLWEKYINVLFQPKIFDVNVQDNQLTLVFDSHDDWWSHMLNGLVIYPKSEEQRGARWLAEFNLRRKEQFDSLHVENLPPAPKPYEDVTERDKSRGYVRFVHSPDRDIQINSVPTSEEVKASLKLLASPGEYEDGCFGIYPLKDCGKVKVTVSDLKGAGGTTIPAARIRLLVQRYKGLNHDAIYTITPKYLDTIPAVGVAIRPGVTRSLWLVVHVPEDARAGIYKGKVTLEFSDGKRDRVDVSLTVWPIKLVELDFPMGMFIVGPSVNYFNLDNSGESYWKEWKDILEDLRTHGMTSLDPSVGMRISKISGGRADIDFSKLDRLMEMVKAAGFRQELMGYAMKLGFRLMIKPGMDLDGIARKYGVQSYAELVKAWSLGVREHAKRKEWLPICWCTDDEYIVHPGSYPEKLSELHRILQDNAPGFRFVALDSVYLESKPKFAPAREKMLRDIDTFGAGVHSPRLAEVVRKAGRRLWLYNTGMNRFTFGTYMFFARNKYNVKGFFQWVYPLVGTYTPHYLASHRESNYGVVYPSTKGLRATPLWERIRAGCDDHRYLETAQHLIEKARAAGKGISEAKALEATIQKTLSKLKFGKPKADAFAGEGRALNPMSPKEMEIFRKAVAEGIVVLQKAMKE